MKKSRFSLPLTGLCFIIPMMVLASNHPSQSKENSGTIVAPNRKIESPIKYPSIDPIPQRGLFESGIELLLNPNIQKSLTLSPAQITAIDHAFKLESESFMALAGKSMDSKSLPIIDRCAGSIRSTLSQNQISSLRSMTFKALGIEAFKLEKFTDSLGLSQTEQKAIQALAAQVDLKQEIYDEELASKLESVPGINSAQLSSQDEQKLQSAIKEVVLSFKAQKDQLSAAKESAFKDAVSALSQDQKNQIP